MNYEAYRSAMARELERRGYVQFQQETNDQQQQQQLADQQQQQLVLPSRVHLKEKALAQELETKV